MPLDCYDWLSLWDFFPSCSHYSAYVSTRTLSVYRGPVCILFRSLMFLPGALPTGRPYPCSPFTLRLLSGVGSHFRSRCYYHSFVVIPADSIISLRQLSRTASWSLLLILVLQRSIVFYDDVSRSTYTFLPLYILLTLILCNTRCLVASKSHLRNLSSHKQSSLSPSLLYGRCVSSWAPPVDQTVQAAPGR